MIVLFSLALSCSAGIYSMLPLYLVVDHGILRVEANTLVAISRVPTLIIVFFAGWAVDRFGAAKVMNVVFALTGSMTILLGLANTSWIKLIVLLQPLFCRLFLPCGIGPARSDCSSPEQGPGCVTCLTCRFYDRSGARSDGYRYPGRRGTV